MSCLGSKSALLRTDDKFADAKFLDSRVRKRQQDIRNSLSRSLAPRLSNIQSFELPHLPANGSFLTQHGVTCQRGKQGTYKHQRRSADYIHQVICRLLERKIQISNSVYYSTTTIPRAEPMSTLAPFIDQGDRSSPPTPFLDNDTKGKSPEVQATMPAARNPSPRVPYLPQDILDQILSHIADTRTLKQCSLASRRLLYVSRKSLFSSIRITSRNFNLVLDTLTPSGDDWTRDLCTIPDGVPKVLTLRGDIPIDSPAHCQALSRTLSLCLSRFQSSITRVELNAVRWNGMARLCREALMGLTSVTEIELDGVVVSDCETAREETVRFLDAFAGLKELSVRDLRLGMVVKEYAAAVASGGVIPLVSSTKMLEDQCDESVSSSSLVSFPPLVKHRVPISLTLDSSDALAIVHQFTSVSSTPLYTTHSVRPRPIESLTFHTPELSTDAFHNDGYGTGGVVSRQTTIGVQDAVMKNVAGELRDVGFVISGYELGNSLHSNNLSNSPSLQSVHFDFTDLSLRHLGSKPLNSIIRTLSTIPPSESVSSSAPISTGDAIQPFSELRTIEMTLRFVHWLGDADYNLFEQVFDWFRLDELIRTRLPLPPSPSASSMDSRESPLPPKTKVVLNLSFEGVRNATWCRVSKSVKAEQTRKMTEAAVDALEGSIRRSMGWCESRGLLDIRAV